jgi:EAL domain-containing protein (putative c-di-GMP-specific phosphodiesterase class I)
MRFYVPQMQVKVRDRVELETDLRLAIRLGQFVIHYQPQIDHNGNLQGVEALVRWNCPKRGVVYPEGFIPMLEETGLILELGHWVIHATCEQLVAWSSTPDMDLISISVNLSARQLHQPDFVSRVMSSIKITGADPRRLELELTESLLLNDVEDTIKKMTALKKNGLSFALDDFGTGYSSLSILKRLPIDRLKIDRSFVREVPEDKEASTIVRAIIGLGNGLGLTIVAEGVETPEQFEFLKRNDCHVFQGYLFSRPLSIEALERLINP